MSVFYPNQDYANVSSYPPTIKMNSTGGYVIDVTMPDSYSAIKISAGDYYVNYAWGLGLNKFIEISDVSQAGYIQNIQNSVEWSTGNRETNAPPSDWLTLHPSCYTKGIELNNASNVSLFNNFSFGMAYPLVINGTSSNISVHGHGIDNSEKPIQINGSGTGINFINTQLVAVGGDSKRYLYTPGDFSGTAKFFNTLAWACTMGVEVNGSGNITMQQWKSVNGPVVYNGGTVWLDSSFLHDTANQVTLASTLTDAAVYANIGNTTTFGVTNNKGDPDVWMNIRK